MTLSRTSVTVGLSAAALAVFGLATAAGAGNPGQSAPTNVTAPSISGAAAVGSTLSGNAGAWRGPGMSFRYAWQRCDAAGANCVTAGAPTTTYLLASADATATFRFAVTASNKNGSVTATSAPTAPVTAAASPTAQAPANVLAPQVSGSAQVGQTLTSSTGSWNGSPTSYGYTWQRCDGSGSNCAPIAGATAASYTLVSSDAGDRFAATVSASNAAGTAVATSGETSTVTDPTAPAPPAAGPSRFGVAAGGNLQNLSSTDLAHYMSLLHAAHVGWVRFDLNWNVIQDAGPSSYNWAPFDNVVKAAAANGIRVLGIILYTPAWARPAGSNSSTPPANLADYATFAGTAAQHYAQLGVHTFEIWNEPNIGQFWAPSPSAARYTQMLKLAYGSVKAADPSATVLSAGLSPYGAVGQSDATHVNPVTFLQQMYANGAKGSMDAVAWHPYAYPYGITYATWSAWSQMAQTPVSARSVMVANGDGAKQIWATEFGEPTGTASAAVSEPAQASYVSDAYAALKSASWAGPAFLYSGWDNGTDATNVEDNFGFVHHDWTPKPAYAAYQTAASAG